MSVSEGIGLIGLAAVTFYCVGRLLVAAWFEAKRRYVQNLVNDTMKGKLHGCPNGK